MRRPSKKNNVAHTSNTHPKSKEEVKEFRNERIKVELRRSVPISTNTAPPTAVPTVPTVSASAPVEIVSETSKKPSKTRPKTPKKTLYLPETMASPEPSTPNKNARAVFEKHMSFDLVQQGLAQNSLHQGSLRINHRNRSDAYVTVEGLAEDIYIPGPRNRNRALHGDKVAVHILTGNELEREQRKVELKKQIKIKENEERQKKVELEDEGSIEEDEDSNSELDEDEDANQEVKLIGKVVRILERPFNQNVSGTLQMENFGKTNPRYIWFKPQDKKVPFMTIDRELAPKEFLDNPKAFEKTFFTASIRKWKEQYNMPFGIVTGKLGQMGELPVETEALLVDAGVTWSDFNEKVLADLPPTPWTIPDSEIAVRRDFRGDCVFSIDPLTAKDLDDAISVKRLSNGLLEVGVHIADVSHFVYPGTALDKEARFRATTVYLVQKAIPMLPRLLCEELCSLNPDVDRLSFSVVWIMNTDGDIVEEPWFGKSVIRSRGKLAYEHAQAIIEGKTWDSLPPVTLSVGTTFGDIKKDVLLFYDLSRKLRKKRYDAGALSIQSIKLWFALDTVGNPISTGVYQIKDSNRLIEEFMLLANMAVAKKISSAFTSASLLRCHPAPNQKGMDKFLDLASKVGYTFDTSSSGSLHASFESIEDPVIRHAWRLLAIKFMKRAVYFNTGDKDMATFRHYALSVPLYTHFTSPIRRYADLVVHRMLHALLQGKKNPYASSHVEDVAKQCNIRKETSKMAQDASQKLYLVALLNNLAETEELIEDAIVTELGPRSVDVIVPRFGIEKRIWIEDLIEQGSAKGCSLDSKSMVLKVHWVRKDEDQIVESMVQTRISEDIIDGDAIESDDDWEDITDTNTGPSSKDSLNKTKKANQTTGIKVQLIRMFDTLRVKIVPLLERSPPEVKLYAVYPDLKNTAHARSCFTVIQDVIVPKVKEGIVDPLQAVASCPAMAEDRD